MENRTENSRRYGGRWRKTQKIMKLCMLFLCAAFLQVSANTYSQEAKLDLKVNNASLEQVMNNIRRQSEFSFFFDDAAVKNISNITLDVRNARIEEVLAACLKGTGFSFRILDKTIILFREQPQTVEQQKFYKVGKGGGRKEPADAGCYRSVRRYANGGVHECGRRFHLIGTAGKRKIGLFVRRLQNRNG